MNENWYNHDYPVDPFGENTSRKTRALIAGVRSEFRFKPVEIPSLDWAGESALKDARTLMHTYKRWNEIGHGDFFLPRHLPLFWWWLVANWWVQFFFKPVNKLTITNCLLNCVILGFNKFSSNNYIHIIELSRLDHVQRYRCRRNWMSVPTFLLAFQSCVRVIRAIAGIGRPLDVFEIRNVSIQHSVKKRPIPWPYSKTHNVAPAPVLGQLGVSRLGHFRSKNRNFQNMSPGP